MNHVQGKLPRKTAVKMQTLQSRLQQLGYEFSEETGNITFSRPGRLEGVLAEILPLVEQGGWDARKELYLEEIHPEKTTRSIYENGRLLRLSPTH